MQPLHQRPYLGGVTWEVKCSPERPGRIDRKESRPEERGKSAFSESCSLFPRWTEGRSSFWEGSAIRWGQDAFRQFVACMSTHRIVGDAVGCRVTLSPALRLILSAVLQARALFPVQVCTHWGNWRIGDSVCDGSSVRSRYCLFVRGTRRVG